ALRPRGVSAIAVDPPTTYNVKAFGALGDGITDDSLSVNNALAAAQASDNGGSVYFPTGRYMIRSALQITRQTKIEISGEGRTSEILWGFDGHLFLWSAAVSCRDSAIHDLMITG